jgi:hypothetical protein
MRMMSSFVIGRCRAAFTGRQPHGGGSRRTMRARWRKPARRVIWVPSEAFPITWRFAVRVRPRWRNRKHRNLVCA